MAGGYVGNPESGHTIPTSLIMSMVSPETAVTVMTHSRGKLFVLAVILVVLPGGYVGYVKLDPVIEGRKFQKAVRPGLARAVVIERLRSWRWSSYTEGSPESLDERLKNYYPRVDCRFAYEVIVIDLAYDRVGVILLTRNGVAMERYVLRT